jgi:hypothetical protein
VELCGPRGTILAVDTRGYHKGKTPTSGHRLIAQLIFSWPEYNVHAPRQPLPSQLDPALSRAMEESPRVFEHFM